MDNEAASCTAVNAGELSIDSSGSLFSPVSLTGGALSGESTVIGSVANTGGTLSPGSDAGANPASDSSATVPEPASGVLLGMSLAAFWLANRGSQKG